MKDNRKQPGVRLWQWKGNLEKRKAGEEDQGEIYVCTSSP